MIFIQSVSVSVRVYVCGFDVRWRLMFYIFSERTLKFAILALLFDATTGEKRKNNNQNVQSMTDAIDWITILCSIHMDIDERQQKKNQYQHSYSHKIHYFQCNP